jgi:hypothetical protein
MRDADNHVLLFLLARATRAFLFGSHILLRHFLLAGNGLRGAFARAGVGVRALTADGKPLAVTQAAIAAEIHQPLDVHRHFAAQIAFDEIVAVDRFANVDDLGVRQLGPATVERDADFFANILCVFRADSMDIAQRDFNALLRGNIDASDTRHEIILSKLLKFFAFAARIRAGSDSRET